MLALGTSLVVALFLVIPELLQRTFVSWFIPLRTIDRSRSDQLARAVFSVLVPLLVTLYCVHEVEPLHRLIFHQYVESPGISARADIKTLFSCVASDDAFKKNQEQFYVALGRSWNSLWPFLATFYLLCISIGVGMGAATINYGAIRAWSEGYTKTTWLRLLLRFVLNKLLLEKVSFWHALLTPFTLADKSAELMLDILTNNGTLYQGISYEYVLEADSKLAGIILKNPRRFARDLYAEAKSQAGDQPVDKEQYWRTIPSESLFIMGSSILNINVNYVPSQPSQIELLQKFLAQALKAKQQIKITVEKPASMDSPPAAESSSEGLSGSQTGLTLI